MERRLRRTRGRRFVGILWLAAVFLFCFPPCAWAATIVPPNPPNENTQEEKHQRKSSPLQDLDDAATTSPEQRKTSSTTAKDISSTTCRWGEYCPDKEHVTTGGGQKQNDSTLETEHHLPFVSKNAAVSASPPEGIAITSRVYTDPDDKLAHFDTTSHIVLEYLDCGASGSTTSPLKVKNAYFRHAMPRASPYLWSGTEFGTHPQLLIPLKPLELLLNSGESQLFQAGDVILLEDVLAAGHKIRSPIDHQDMSALLLTLPQHYHHVGKDRVSLTTNNRNKAIAGCDESSRDALFRERIRTIVFASIGLGVSSLFAVFLGKVAPLWLSVGVGGICFITGGTYAAVQCGEYAWQQGELAMERRRLLKAQHEQEKEEDELLVVNEEVLLEHKDE